MLFSSSWQNRRESVLAHIWSQRVQSPPHWLSLPHLTSPAHLLSPMRLSAALIYRATPHEQESDLARYCINLDSSSCNLSPTGIAPLPPQYFSLPPYCSLPTCCTRHPLPSHSGPSSAAAARSATCSLTSVLRMIPLITVRPILRSFAPHAQHPLGNIPAARG